MLCVDKRESEEDMRKPTIRSLTAKGYSQKKIAKILGIRKMKVVTAQKALKIGKRRKSEFWSDVRTHARTREISWSEAREQTKDQPYWARKRAARQGKQYKSYSEFWKEWRQKWRDATEAEKEEHGYNAIYGEEGEFVGGTPQ